jgi:hypothetical protein
MMTQPAGQDQALLTKPKFIIAAVVVALIAALGIILILIPKGGPSPAAAPSAAGPTSTAASSQPAASAASVCGLPAGDQAKPASPLSETKWELVGKIAAPTSPAQFGPGRRDANGLRSCFAHSPTGALYAAANITALSSAGKARLVFEDLAVPSAERDAVLAQPDQSPTSATTAQIAGYQIRSYSSDRAVIVIAAKGDNGALVSVPVPLQWYGGDWKFIVPASGSTGAGQIPDLSGFIPWSGV